VIDGVDDPEDGDDVPKGEQGGVLRFQRDVVQRPVEEGAAPGRAWLGGLHGIGIWGVPEVLWDGRGRRAAGAAGHFGCGFWFGGEGFEAGGFCSNWWWCDGLDQLAMDQGGWTSRIKHEDAANYKGSNGVVTVVERDAAA